MEHCAASQLYPTAVLVSLLFDALCVPSLVAERCGCLSPSTGAVKQGVDSSHPPIGSVHNIGHGEADRRGI